jgi:hypothetical protein
MGLFALLPLGFPGFIPLGALTAATPARPSHAWLLLEHRHSDGVAMSSSDSAVKKAWSHFYQEYGQAMLAWQLVESELATVFSMLTNPAGHGNSDLLFGSQLQGPDRYL